MTSINYGANHHVGKTTLINHLISIGEWEDGV